MTPHFDGAIILDCTTHDYTNSHKTTGYIRPLAPFGLYDLFYTHNIPCTVINYVNFWQPDELTDLLTLWCEKTGVKQPLLLCSSLFCTYLHDELGIARKCINQISKAIDCKIILGGPVDLTMGKGTDDIQPYAIFKGRSLHILEYWINKQEPPADIITAPHLIPCYHNKSNVIVEKPIVPLLHDDYCLTSKDVIAFETRLGCKFNCTFCAYEFRNAKKVKDSSVEQLYNFFNEAYEKYGITNFTCADDTFNEDDEKIHTLHQAITQLSFKPTIAGYNRLDVMIS